MPGDYDGSGRTELAVYFPAWASSPTARPAAGPTSWSPSGPAGDGTIPVPGDYSGSGQTEIAVYDPNYGVFAYRPGGGGPDVIVHFGAAGPGLSLPAAAPIAVFAGVTLAAGPGADGAGGRVRGRPGHGGRCLPPGRLGPEPPGDPSLGHAGRAGPGGTPGPQGAHRPGEPRPLEDPALSPDRSRRAPAGAPPRPAPGRSSAAVMALPWPGGRKGLGGRGGPGGPGTGPPRRTPNRAIPDPDRAATFGARPSGRRRPGPHR